MPSTMEASPPATATPAAPAAAPPAAPPLNPMSEAMERMKSFAKSDNNPAEHAKPGKSPASKAIAAKPAEPAPENKVEPPTETPETPTDELGEESEVKAPEPETKVEEQTADDPNKAAADKGKKVSPWKLVDQYKTRVTELEKQLAEIKTKPPADPEKQTLAEKLAEHEKRLKEYEEEIRFTNYQKHPEFLDKYHKPYEESWVKAMGELKGLKVSYQDAAGETHQRDLSIQDLSVLANMEPAEARALIKEKFPDDAEEVKYHIKEIRRLAEARSKALDDARKGADQRQQQMTESMKKMQEESAQLWQKFNSEAVEKHEFLKPLDGKPERNERLAKAQEFVDKAFAENAGDPKLSTEQRAEILRKHAAVRNRAIAYSVLRYENSELRSRLAELEESLKTYQKSEPTNGDGKSAKAEAPRDDSMDSIVAGLASYARPK